MAEYTVELTKSEIDEFIAEANGTAMMGFGGDDPYVIPMGYTYKRGDMLIGLITKPYGRKMQCLEQNPKICYTVCRTRAQTNLKQPCTTVVIEGTLEKVTDRGYYGLGPERPEVHGKFGMALHKVVPDKVSGRRCAQKPCELLTARAKEKAAKKAATGKK
jgi:hypothetical protein